MILGWYRVVCVLSSNKFRILGMAILADINGWDNR
jgi:hypothetical protein